MVVGDVSGVGSCEFWTRVGSLNFGCWRAHSSTRY